MLKRRERKYGLVMWVTLNFLGMQQGSHFNDSEKQNSNNMRVLEMQQLNQFHTRFYSQKLFCVTVFQEQQIISAVARP